MARYAFGVVGFLAVVGVLTYASVHFGLGRLPGDIVIDRGSFYFYLPITTAILVSLGLTLVLWLLSR